MKKTVLIVEDDQDIQEYYEVVLKSLDIEILKAENGLQALAMVDMGKKIDLILLDIIMPVMDGYEFFKTLRRKRKSRIPVVPCSVDDLAIKKLEEVEAIQKTFLKFSHAQALKDLVKERLGI